MRYYPEDEYDWKEVKELGLRKNDWKLNMLKKNPEYLSWGNHEDYMIKNEKSWESPVELEKVQDLWELDDLNELVNFYFEIYRRLEECKQCEGTGLNSATKKISDDWYDFEYKGTRWCDKITQDEVDALWIEGRLRDFKEKPTAEQVNERERKGFMHDAINRCICIEQRAKRLGVYGYCSTCEGKGYNYIEDKVHLGLQMWFIHPRKGASRGVFLKNIEREELPQVINYLKDAQKRNNQRFSKLAG